jgi:hypothetical protein
MHSSTGTKMIGLGTATNDCAVSFFGLNSESKFIAGAIIAAENFVDTAGAEAADLAFFMRSAGASLTATAKRMSITSKGNVILGNRVALATTATDGFPYLPTCAGAPTGAATAYTGQAPMVVDSTNNRLYIRVGSTWKYVTLT